MLSIIMSTMSNKILPYYLTLSRSTLLNRKEYVQNNNTQQL